MICLDIQKSDQYIQSIGISRNKWEDIHSFIDYDLPKLVDIINNKFQRYWAPFPNVVINESLCPYFGSQFFLLIQKS